MNAVKMLKQQHREVEKLFERLESARSAEPRRKIFEEIADALAVHAAIEERHFYPGVRTRRRKRSCWSPSKSISRSSASSRISCRWIR